MSARLEVRNATRAAVATIPPGLPSAGAHAGRRCCDFADFEQFCEMMIYYVSLQNIGFDTAENERGFAPSKVCYSFFLQWSLLTEEPRSPRSNTPTGTQTVRTGPEGRDRGLKGRLIGSAGPAARRCSGGRAGTARRAAHRRGVGARTRVQHMR